jgi:redox-sensitive bicupin YhaK (pirin superfamily)
MKRRNFIHKLSLATLALAIHQNLFSNTKKEQTMEKIIERAADRGQANHGWLQTRFSFSFSNYYNPKRIHFGALRVVNDDYIAAASGFGTHPHDNMEIVTIPLQGTLTHADSMGHTQTITPGEVQVMSAGTGLTHSEYNHEPQQAVTLFQVWVFPRAKNYEPRYDQRRFDPAQRHNQWQTIVNPDHEGALWIHQDAWFRLADFDAGQHNTYTIARPGNGIFLMVIEGQIEIADETLHPRDTISLSGISQIDIKTLTDTKLLLIDIPL